MYPSAMATDKAGACMSCPPRQAAAPARPDLRLNGEGPHQVFRYQEERFDRGRAFLVHRLSEQGYSPCLQSSSVASRGAA